MNSIGEILSKYRTKNRISQQEVSNYLGSAGFTANNRTVSNWENNISEPSIPVLMTLCRYLGITDLYGEYFGSNPADMMSELNEEGKEKARDYIRLLIDSGKYQPVRTTVIPFQRSIRLFSIPASAGTGNFLDSGDYTEIEVGEEVPFTADFGIRISGDSMEPQFINGQIVWVHRQETLSSGEIGIFYLDGNAFCKKLQDDENGLFLISLNQKYAPITVKEDDSFKIFGKVVG